MTAAVSAGYTGTGSRIRRFDPGRDLASLSNLIEVGFADNLDRSGRRMVRSLRVFGRLGWLGGLLSRWFLPPAANPQGYVFEADGHVLGNASLLPVTGYPQRWVMANVVVSPQERRKGIGRMLVTKSIDLAREKGAKEIILQVDKGNTAATSLYHSMDFNAAAPRTTWVGRTAKLNLGVSHPSPVRPRKQGEWQQQWQMARRLHPEGLLWPFPVSPGYFRERSWQQQLGLRLDRHWVWPEGDRLVGMVSLRWALEPGTMRMILVVDHERRGKIEADLIAAAIREMGSVSEVIQLDYPSSVAGEVLETMGFIAKRHLVWMLLKL